MGLPPLKWSPKLAKLAERHAAKMAEVGRLYHERGRGYEENVACVPNTENPALTARLFAVIVLSSPHIGGAF